MTGWLPIDQYRRDGESMQSAMHRAQDEHRILYHIAVGEGIDVFVGDSPMTPDLTDLARRAVACPHWRWVPRMRARLGNLDAGDVAAVGALGVAVVWDWECGAVWHDDDDLTPDLSDPATVGCLLALVREAWGDADIFGLHYHRDGGWCVEINDRHFYGSTPAAALVAALEAAPTNTTR